MVCLKKAERDMYETMLSLERDEEYMPSFKSCVKDRLNDIIEARGKLALKGENYGHHYTLDHENAGDSRKNKGK